MYLDAGLVVEKTRLELVSGDLIIDDSRGAVLVLGPSDNRTAVFKLGPPSSLFNASALSCVQDEIFHVFPSEAFVRKIIIAGLPVSASSNGYDWKKSPQPLFRSRNKWVAFAQRDLSRDTYAGSCVDSGEFEEISDLDLKLYPSWYLEAREPATARLIFRWSCDSGLAWGGSD